MFNSSDEVLKYIKDEDVKFVDVRFIDLPGVMQHFNMPVESFDQDVFDDGLMFDGSSIRGFQAIHESDMKLIPDPATAFIDPFRENKTLVMNFSIRDPFTNETYSRDPRNIAAKAEAYLKSTGIADTVYFGAEAEFYVFDDVRFESKQNASYYYIDSIEGAWNTGREEEGGNLGYKTRYKGGYFPVPPVDHFADIRDEMVNKLLQVGLHVERSHHEVGTAGQGEINYKFNTLQHAADEMMLFKYVIKNVAWSFGKSATFMPKPLFGDNGSGMHCHQSLWKDGEPLFYDERGYGGLSDIARWYIGGLLAARAVAAGLHQPDRELLPPARARLRGAGQPGVLGPQPLRLHPHPGHRQLAEGQADRVPRAGPVEQPVPGVLGQLMAGLDGIKNKIEPLAPVDKDLYELPPDEHAAIPQVPGSLSAVLDAPREGQRVPAGGRRVPGRPDRDLDRLQAHQRGRPDPPASAPARVRAVLRHLGTTRTGIEGSLPRRFASRAQGMEGPLGYGRGASSCSQPCACPILVR